MPDGGATSCGRWFPARPSWGGSSRRLRNIRLARCPERLAWKKRFSSFRLELPEAANNGKCLMKRESPERTHPVVAALKQSNAEDDSIEGDEICIFLPCASGLKMN